MTSKNKKVDPGSSPARSEMVKTGGFTLTLRDFWLDFVAEDRFPRSARTRIAAKWVLIVVTDAS